ncbi:MAG: tyrosine-type recombinase/integrase, partial [Pseudomonadota bacterium]
KTWQVMYRIGGRKRRLSLGTFPVLPVGLARESARTLLAEVAKGKDPAAQRASARGGSLTFEEFAQAYVERYAKRRKQTWQEDKAAIARDLLPAWGHRPVDAIGRRDVIALIEGIGARGHGYAANRRLSLLRTMFAWGVEVAMVPATPVIGIEPPGHEQRRQRVLDDAEITALWHAWETMAWPFGVLFKLLLLTAQRRNQMANLRLADIALADQVWTVGGTKSGGRRQSHAIPLSTHALEIITSVPRSPGAFVFPARGRTDRTVTGFSKAAQRASKLSGVTDWRTEDLRRTAAAGMLDLQVPSQIVRDILNRAAPTMIAGINVLETDTGFEAMRAALEAWGEKVRDIVTRTGAPNTHNSV